MLIFLDVMSVNYTGLLTIGSELFLLGLCLAIPIKIIISCIKRYSRIRKEKHLQLEEQARMQALNHDNAVETTENVPNAEDNNRNGAY